MSTTDTRPLTALKSIALAATFTVATAQTTTSLLFIPSILKPLRDPNAPFASTTTTRKNSSGHTLNIPSTPGADGRLTPQPFGTFDFTTGSSGTYKAIARQFSYLNSLTSRAVLPLEVLAVGLFTISAFRSRSAGSAAAWKQYAFAASLITSLPFVTSFWTGPLVTKIKRIGGEEEKIEPYEDAPIDFEAEKANTVEFLGRWSIMNLGKGVAMFAAGVVAGITVLDE